jgi:hypothetical protein
VGETVLIGNGKEVVGIPRSEWETGLVAAAERMRGRLGFMSKEHHLVRDFVVRELPRKGVPLAPEVIAQGTNLALSTVNPILEELERNMTFLFRDPQGAVAWAYPVTVDETPHRVLFNTGERVYAA